jgi:hypothetical protein
MRKSDQRSTTLATVASLVLMTDVPDPLIERIFARAPHREWRS